MTQAGNREKCAFPDARPKGCASGFTSRRRRFRVEKAAFWPIRTHRGNVACFFRAASRVGLPRRSPNASCPECLDLFIGSQNRELLDERLSRQHAIERVAMRAGERTRAQTVLACDRQLQKAVLTEPLLEISHHWLALRKLAHSKPESSLQRGGAAFLGLWGDLRRKRTSTELSPGLRAAPVVAKAIVRHDRRRL